MKFSSITGIILAGTVFITSVFLSFSNIFVIFNLNSVLIVFGGTVATALICIPIKVILSLVKAFFKKVIFEKTQNQSEIITEIVNLAKASRKGVSTFERMVQQIKHHFLKEGAEILFWSEENITKDELRDLLETRVMINHERYMNEANILKSVSQFPPAFGLMGTTMGMIALLQDLSKDGSENLGKSMAIALITTLYGLALSNFFIGPIAERLANDSQEEFIIRRMIVEGLMLIHEGKHPRYVEEFVISYISPKDRPSKSR